MVLSGEGSDTQSVSPVHVVVWRSPGGSNRKARYFVSAHQQRLPTAQSEVQMISETCSQCGEACRTHRTLGRCECMNWDLLATFECPLVPKRYVPGPPARSNAELPTGRFDCFVYSLPCCTPTTPPHSADRPQRILREMSSSCYPVITLACDHVKSLMAMRYVQGASRVQLCADEPRGSKCQSVADAGASCFPSFAHIVVGTS